MYVPTNAGDPSTAPVDDIGDRAELTATYLRLTEAGIEPALCVDHGVTLSYYYADPDGNQVELQMDAFGDWAWSKAWIKHSKEAAA